MKLRTRKMYNILTLDLNVFAESYQVANAGRKISAKVPSFTHDQLGETMVCENLLLNKLNRMFNFKEIDGIYQTPHVIKVAIENSSDALNINTYLRMFKTGFNVKNKDGSVDVYTYFEVTTNQLRTGGAYFIKTEHHDSYFNILCDNYSPYGRLGTTPKQISAMALQFSGCYCVDMSQAEKENKNKELLVICLPDPSVEANANIVKVNGTKDGSKPEDSAKVVNGVKCTQAEYNVKESVEKMILECCDGGGMNSPTLAMNIVCSLLGITKERVEKERRKGSTYYSKVIKPMLAFAQLRMPGIKGVNLTVDAVAYMREKGINELIDIYGRRFTIQDLIDNPNHMIFTKSQFKDFAKYHNIDEYLKALNGTVEVEERIVNPADGEVYVTRVNKELYPNREYLGVIRVGTSPKDYTDMSYEFVQTLSDLSGSDLIELADRYTSLANDALTDPHAAAILLGQNASTEKGAEMSTIDRVSTILSVLPQANNLRVVRNVILSNTKNKFNGLNKGKTPAKGHFATFGVDMLAALHQKNPHEKDGYWVVDPFEQNENVGILKKGEFFANGWEGTTTFAKYPLNMKEELRKIRLSNLSAVHKWYPYLDGSNMLLANVFDGFLMYFASSGGDVDGDSALLLNPYDPINRRIIDAIDENLPIVVSCIEGKLANKVVFSNEAVLQTVKNTLDNLTGLLTEFSTYYANLRIQASRTFDYLIDECSRDFSNIEDKLRRNLPPEEASLISQLSVLRADEVIAKLVDMKAKWDTEYRNIQVIIRTAQAGELDKVKTGETFLIPLSIVESSKRPLWRAIQN